MKKQVVLLILTFSVGYYAAAQETVEAEFDTAFHYQFEPVKTVHKKTIIIDEAHNTIYAEPYGKETGREMLSIMAKDGFNIRFTKSFLDSVYFQSVKPDMLILHGMPNKKIKLDNGNKNEFLYKSPLTDQEVESIARYVYKGGSLFLFLSHFPNGSGALPLLEAFSIKFRDGYAYHPKSPGYNCDLCSHFIMTPKNQMINTGHPVIATRLSDKLFPDTVKFLCGAAVFRNPEDNILPFPRNTINFTPTTDGTPSSEESSDAYAGMIGFNYGSGRVIVCTDQGIFRSLDLLIDGKRLPVTIHDPHCDNAALFLNSVRWLTKLQ